MKKLSKEQLYKIKGGAAFSLSSTLNAITKAIATLFSLGQAVGSAIRRASSRNYC